MHFFAIIWAFIYLVTMKKAFLTILVILVAAAAACGQQSDTGEVVKRLQPQETYLQPHNERHVGNMYMPRTGQFSIPEPKQYYTRPFMGQKYLEIALEAYYEKWKGEKSLLYRFINTVAPLIKNQFTFAVYRVYDLPIVDRDNPLLDPQLIKKDEKNIKQ